MAEFSGQIQPGGFFCRTRLAVTRSMIMRLREVVATELSWGYNDVGIPAGAFTTNLARVRKLRFQP